MRAFRMFAVVGILTGGLAGGWLASQAEAPAAAPAPQVRLLLENDRVRLREIVLPPGSSTGRHTHQVPELAYAFTAGPLRVVVPGEPAVVEHWRAGEARWRDAGVTHEVANDGPADMRVLVIDVK